MVARRTMQVPVTFSELQLVSKERGIKLLMAQPLNVGQKEYSVFQKLEKMSIGQINK